MRDDGFSAHLLQGRARVQEAGERGFIARRNSPHAVAHAT